MTAGPFVVLRDHIEAINQAPPESRLAALRDARANLVDQLGRIDTYIRTEQRRADADARLAALGREFLRENADLRPSLIEQGSDPKLLDEAGYLDHGELDRLDEEGLLDEAARQFVARFLPEAPARADQSVSFDEEDEVGSGNDGAEGDEAED